MVMRRSPLQRLLTHKPALTSLLLLALPVLTGLFFLATPFTARGESEPAGSEERLRELLTERYNVLQQMYASLQLHLKSGRADEAEWRRAALALYGAEAELCTTETARIKVYEKLVQAMKSQEDLAVRRADAGRITKWQLAEARAATLQAQIDLERARLGRQTPW